MNSYVTVNDIAPVLRAIYQRVSENERRSAGMEMRGKVTDVDAAKQLARISIGKDEDGADVKSPWLPYQQVAGAMKIHSPPSVGQVMSARSMSGDLEQGVLAPFHWSDDNKSNSDSGDEHKMTFGSVTVTLKGDGVTVSAGGTTVHISGEGLIVDGGTIKNNSKDVGSNHTHTGVTPGAADTGAPT